MAHVEPMDLESIESDFDNKENTHQPNNALSRVLCMEKGYEELDVSELNMKLRYSITPASSPMSKSFTANSMDNKYTTSVEDYNMINSHQYLTRSLNSTMTNSDTILKAPKSLPLQSISTEQHTDLNRNLSVRRSLDAAKNNITVTISGAHDVDNLSLPSTSSSLGHTPEATTPTKEIPKQDGGSPIMRGLKSVLSMFRPSQSPIPLSEDKKDDVKDPPESELLEPLSKTQTVLASTPIRNKNIKSNSPLKESLVFNDDLEKELQWKEDSAVFFKEEKIPVHKLLFSSQPNYEQKPIDNLIKDSGNTTVEYMDISANESVSININNSNIPKVTNNAESDSEFLDCETTFNKTNPLDIMENKTFEILSTATELTQNTDINMSITDNDNSDKVCITAHPIKSQVIVVNHELNEAISIEPLSIKGEDTSQSTININEMVNIDKPLENILTDVNLDTRAMNVTETINYEAPLNIEIKINETVITESFMDSAFAYGYSDTGVENKNQTINIDTPCITEDKVNQTACLEIGNIGDVTYSSEEVKIDTEICIEAPLNAELNANEIESQLNILKDLEGMELNQTVSIANTDETTTSDLLLPDVVRVSQDEGMPTKLLFNTDTPVNNKYDEVEDGCKNVMEIISESVEVQNKTVLLSNYSPACDLNADSGMLHVYKMLDSHQSNKKKNEDLSNNNLLSKISDGDVKNLNNVNLDITLTNDLEKINISQSDDGIFDTSSRKALPLVIDSDKTSLEPLAILDQGDIVCLISNKTDNDMMNNEDQTASMCKNSVYNDTFSKSTIHGLSLNMSIDESALLNDSLEDQTINNCIDNLPVSLNDDEIFDKTNSLDNKTLSICTVDEDKDRSIIQLPFEDNPFHNKSINSDVMKESESHKSSLKDLFKSVDEKSKEFATLSEKPTSVCLNIHNLGLPVIEGEVENDIYYGPPEIKTDNTDNEEPKKIIDSTLVTKELVLKNQLEVNRDNTTSDKNCNKTENYENVHNNTLNDCESTKQVIDIITLNDLANDTINNSMANPLTLIEATNDCIKHMEDSFNNIVTENVECELQITTLETCKPNELINQMEDKFKTKSKILISPSTSPKIVSKGYNLNFDEMEDPFATNIKISSSPPPENPVNETFKPNLSSNNELSNQKTILQHRRKSQPAPKKQNVIHKKGLNSTIEVAVSESMEKNRDPESSDCVSNYVKIITDTILQQPIDSDHAIDDESVKLMEENNIYQNLNEVQELEIVYTKSDTVKEDENEYRLCTLNNSAEVSRKNVFNLPEIDDKNFNPFATRSKMCASPPPLNISVDVEDNELFDEYNTTVKVNHDITNGKACTLDMETSNENNITSSSSRRADVTLKEVNTEDEDTVEGPFFEAEELAEFNKDNDVPNIEKHDFIGFNDFPKQETDDTENEEMFIDAEAFEFLLNQNKSNIVTDSGKESLFLKFDPLFAKRISSDGILAALNNVQLKQSTPKKTVISGEKSIYSENTHMMPSSSKAIPPFDQIDDSNINLSKPTMVVNPAVSSVITPRKSASPSKINRQSLTFTSPAMAVIDRLLSLSGNTSTTLCHDTSLTQFCAEQHHTDIALTQLREMLADKEIHVQTLRTERKELTNRLVALESQVKSMEFESEDRLRKITDLNRQLSEKNKLNKTMATVVEEYERTIAALVAELEQDRRRNAEERMMLIRDRDEQTAHLASMEISFHDLHSKYEKSKQIIFGLKANEDNLKKSLNEFEDNLLKIHNNYELLKQHATSKLNHANQELERINKAHEADVLKLKAMVKRKDLDITSLKETLAQKTKANEELTGICDELINKVG